MTYYVACGWPDAGNSGICDQAPEFVVDGVPVCGGHLDPAVRGLLQAGGDEAGDDPYGVVVTTYRAASDEPDRP